MPNTKIIIYTLDDFKTINQRTKRNLLPRNVGYNAKNLRYDTEDGSLVKRLSRAKYNTTSLGANQVHGLHRFYKNSTNSAALLIGYSSALRIGYDGNGVSSVIRTGLASTKMSFQTFKDNAYIVNGSNANMVFTLDKKTQYVEDMGVPSITAPVGVLSATNGNLTGTVFYAVSPQLDGYQEGNIGPTTTQYLFNRSQATISIPRSTNSRCTARYLYRTKGDQTTLYRVATIAGNVNTSYADNTADTSLDTSTVGPTDYNIPAKYKYICLHKSRIFLGNNESNKSDLIFSDIRNGIAYPDVFPLNNILYIAKDDGDELTAIKNDHFGNLIVFKENSVRMINTNAESPKSWELSDPLSNQGCVAPYSAVTTPIGIIYLSRYGDQKKRLLLWNGVKSTLLPELEGLEPVLSSIPDTAMVKDVFGHYANGYYHLAYRRSVSAVDYNDEVVIINIYTWQFSFDNKNVAVFCSWNGGTDNGEMYSGSSDNLGLIYREDTSSYDTMIRYKSELDGGVLSQTQSLGAENTPSLGLTSDISNDVGAMTWAQMSSTSYNWSSLRTYNDSWWLCGQWTSQVIEISAKTLNALYWNETRGVGTEVLFWVKVGDTVAACETDAPNGPYTAADGSSLTALTAGKYIQVIAKLFTKHYANVDSVTLYRNGTLDSNYVIKVAANFGSPAETTIEFDWESGRIDLGDLNEAFKRVRKRLRSIKIEYDADATASGNFDFEYYFNGSTTKYGAFNTSYSKYPNKRTYNFPLRSFCDDFFYRIHSTSDNQELKIRKITFVLNTEPYKVQRRRL